MKRLLLRFMALAFLSASAAQATELPPVDVSIAPFVELPQVGQPITLSFELTSEIAGIVTDVGFVSESPNPTAPDPDYYWDIIGHTAPASLPLLPLQPASFDMTMDCNDPSEAIRIEFQFDGQWIRRDFFLLPLGANDLYEDTTLMTVPGSKVGPTPRNQSLAIPDLSPNLRTDIVDVSEDGVVGKVSVRLFGQITYRREDFLRVGADGVSVRAYDRGGGGIDLYLGAQVTDSDGYFDFTVNAGASPDLYLEVVMGNHVGDVIYPSIARDVYTFTTPTDYNWSGSERDYGTLSTTESSLAPALHIMTTMTRAWRFAANAGFGSIGRVNAWWPSGDNASYSRYYRLIHISDKRMWDEFTIGHEYGHHFTYEFGAKLVTEYCNDGDYADSDDDCNHRAWCPENDGVAWSEGFAHWYGSVLRAEIEDAFGTTIAEQDFELLEGCPENNDQFGPFELTEGFLATFCQDLSDGDNEEDPGRYEWGKDRLSYGNAAILELVDEYEPVTAVGFVNAVLAEAPPEDRKAIWATAANNRYNFDNTPPPDVSALFSTSHQTSGDSPDATVELWWNPVTDDTSGIAFYRIQVADNPSFSGLNVATFEDSTPGTWTSPKQLPGDYWFRIYVMDKAGNLSTGWSDFGPVTIRAATPPDLVPSHGTWSQPVLAKSFAGAPFEISPFLFGNIANTYYSMSVGNGGELDATGTLTHRFYVDGVLSYWFDTTNLAAFGQESRVDIGPDNVRGGRHNLTFIADADEGLSESDEDNNWYRRQYIWSGMGLDENWRVRGKAPDPFGGFETTSVFTSPNCDGFSYSTQIGVFRGVVLKPTGSPGDYGDHDLRSFPISTGSTDGFSTFQTHAISSRPLGCLDAIITMNDLTTGTLFNAGVYNFANTDAAFEIRRIESIPINDQVVTPISIAADDFLNLYHVTLVGGAPGGDFATLRVSSDPADGLLHAAVFDMATTHVGLDDALVTGQSDEFGEIVLDFDQINGRHVVAVWQDPKDAEVPAVTVAATVWIGQTPPDLVPTVAAGWSAPVVPSDGAPGSPGSVGWPAQLQGNAATTYFNHAIRNEGPTMAANFHKLVYLDGVGMSGAQISQLAPLGNHLSNYATAYTVQGGRHTLSGLADDSSVVTESSETNNAFGQQWVWSPFQLGAPGPWIVRAAPPDAAGGWDHVLSQPIANPSGPPVYFNCDGLRTPMPGIVGDDGWWQSVAVMAQGTADYDVRLHEIRPGVEDGFKGIRETSTWAGQGVDYVLVDFRNTQVRQFDVGVVESNGSKNYWAQVVESNFLGSSPTGSFGAFSIAADELMNLHEMYLDAGPLTISTQNQSGTVDWGMTLHRAKLPYQSKTSELDASNTSWLMGGAGGGEELFVQIPEAGYYCLAVWRADNSNSGEGFYTLEFDAVTGVDSNPQLPRRTALRSVHPSPFNPRTTIEFELARDTQTVVQIYDLRGAHVKTLLRQSLPAGRHEIVWAGIDDRGQRVSSGTYFVQLLAGEVRETRKVSLVK